nr:glycolate oxidase subunit GlcE [uncultured Undibacterium sp.]
MNPVLQQFREQILLASESKLPLRIQGGATKSWYGNQVNGEVLDTRAYAGVIAYEPTELVLSVRAGTTLKEVESLLDQHGQILACEAPHFGEHATVGGMLAAGLSGPRRAYAGGIRDFVLGVTMMNGRGELLKFGGQVMKNVAGYDVSRLMVGSMGALGLITEISLKVMPRPLLETSLAFALSEQDALHCLNKWAGQALPISASAYHAGRLMLRLSGSESAIRLAKQKLGGQDVHDDKAFWISLREQQHHFFTPEQGLALLRLSLPSTASALKLRTKTLIEWGGAQRWIWTHEPIQSVRELMQNLGGHVTQFRYADASQAAFTPLHPALLKIHQQLKKTFDPFDIFNRGRLFPSD